MQTHTETSRLLDLAECWKQLELDTELSRVRYRKLSLKTDRKR